jgi:hypothetical protein
MKEDFPIITISGISEPVKAYSIDLSGGGQEQARLRILFIDNSSVNFEPDSTNLITVTIGNFYTFKGYIVSVSNKESVSSGKTTELSLIDNSIILDKLWVGLKGKYGPPQAYSRGSQSKKNTINLNDLAKVVNFTSINSNANDDLNNLYIFETHGSFPSNLILVGEAIDPCAKLQLENYFDPCDPCSSQQKYLNLEDCQKNRDFQILDVDYTFADLISAASLKRVNFSSEFSEVLNYRAQYVGSLREVLGQWCEDYGYSFYWDGEKVVFINLASGIKISDGNLLNSEKCKIEDISITKSIEGNVKNLNIAYFGKNGEIKEYDCLSKKSSKATNDVDITLLQISLDRIIESSKIGAYYGGSRFPGRATSVKTLKNYRICAMLSKASESEIGYFNIRKSFIWEEIYGFTSAGAVRLGDFPLIGRIIAVSQPGTSTTQSGPYDPSVMRAVYHSIRSEEKFSMDNDSYILITEGDIFSDTNDSYIAERGIANAIGRVWMKSTNQTDAKYSYTHPDGTLEIFEGSETYTDKKGFTPAYIINPTDLKVNGLNWNFLETTKADLTKTGGTYILLKREPIWQIKQIVTNDNAWISGYECSLADITDEAIAFLPGFKSTIPDSYDVDKSKIKVYIFRPSRERPKFSTTLVPTRIEKNREEFGRTGLKSNKVYSLRSDTFGFRGGFIETPPIGNYVISRQEQSTSLQDPPLKAIIPKLEMIIMGENSNVNDKNYISCNVNYKDITDNDLSKQTQIGNRCFVDRSKVYSYGSQIIKDLSNNDIAIKETKTYTILGIPDSNFSPEDGLSSFSLRLDSSGTKTLLNFSNTLPKGKSENVIKKQLDYLLKKQFNKSYINNILE